MNTTTEQKLDAPPQGLRAPVAAEQTVFNVLFAISFAHLLNDIIQALIPSLYPVLKGSLGLTFGQIGLITLVFQCTASLFQPLVGMLSDRRPMPYSLAMGMGMTLVGLLMLSQAHSFTMVVVSAGVVGLGSAVFHPEASRVAHMAAGPRRGLAQSLFQLGGNAGSSLGPLLALLVVVPRGQAHVAWFALLAGAGIWLLWHVGTWQWNNRHRMQPRPNPGSVAAPSATPRRTVIRAMAVLMALMFSKYVYLVSLTNYYTFYLMQRFGVSVGDSQLYLSIFLFAVAAGTIIGGPVGDRIGRKRVIWASILGTAPFSLLLPHVGLVLTVVLSVFIGLIIASTFSSILVYAQELIPGRVGMIAGLFFGVAFGVAGIGAAVLGKIADHTGIIPVFQGCAFLPLIGLLTVFLPEARSGKKR